MGRSLSGSAGAVSYTHLDVYKRQTVILAGIAVQAVLSAGISFFSLLDTDVLVSYNYFSVGGLSNSSIDPVSYTHLSGGRALRRLRNFSRSPVLTALARRRSVVALKVF